MQKLLLLLLGMFLPGMVMAQTITTVYGSSERAYIDGAGNQYFVTWTDLIKRDLSNNVTTLKSGGGHFQDMAMDAQGNIYLTDFNTSTIYKITPGGSSSVFSTQVASPHSIAITPSGDIFVTEYYTAKVCQLASNGAASVFATLTGPNCNPHQICSDAAGNLFVSTGPDGLLRKVTPLGVVSTVNNFGSFTVGCAVAPDGWIYVSLHLANQVVRYHPATGITQTIVQPVFVNGPMNLSVAGGDLYVGARSSNTLKVTGVYTPIPATGLDLWLKANEGVSTLAGTVTGWADKSPNGRNAIASGSPIFATNVVNGKPVVRFGGSNAGLTTPSFATFPNKRGSVFVVSKSNANVSYGTLIGTYFGTNPAWQFGAYSSTFGYYDGGPFLSNVAIGTSSPNQWGIVNLARESDNQQKLYYNGVLDGTLSIANVQVAPNPVKIGWNGAQTNIEVFSGDIAEILVYGYDLSQSQRDSVNQYLAAKYNISIVTTTPAIALSSTSLNFGKLGLGFSLEDSIIISNRGTAPLNISGITSSSPALTLSYAKTVVPVGDTVRLKIRYQPAVAGTTAATITISHNAGSNSTISVAGEAVATGFTHSLHFLPGFSGNLHGASWFNGQKGFVSGANGTLYRTLDGGASWSPLSFGNTAIALRSIRCIGPDLWLFGDNGHICVSHDGGVSFSAFNGVTASTFHDAYFVNANYGFAVGDNGTICRYDGAWQNYGLGLSNTFYGVYAYGTSAWAVGSGGIVCRYNYASNSWGPINPGVSNDFYGVGFWDDNIGYIVGSGGIICKTTNGGTNWTPLTSGVTVDIRGIRCFSASVAWACCANGMILQTTDGGATWVKLPIGNFNWQRVDFNGCNGIAICHNGAVLTFQTNLCNDSYNPYYTRSYLGSPYPMYGACFTSRTSGGICGGYGSFFITNDGGQSWNSSNTNTLSNIRCIRIFGNKAFICGSGGFIAHCNNGGTNWQTFTGLPPGVTFYSMSFYANGTGWAVGSGGTICYYNGTGWSPYTTGVTFDFCCVYVIGNVAYACGANGGVWKYNGSAWVDVSPAGVSNDFYACAFVKPNVGYVVGANGIVCKTTDGGQTWFPVSGPCGCHLYCVKVGCIDEVMVAGAGGNAYQSTDGGSSWTSHGLGLATDIHDVHLAGGAGYIAGAEGGAYGFDFGSDTLTTEISLSGPTTFCAGGSVTLTARGGTNYSYAWSNSTTGASVTAQTGGTYSVVVKDAMGCEASASETVTVKANPVVAITPSGNTAFCQGGSVTLTASGGASYAWNNSATTPAITVNTSGTYTVTGTGSNGCTATASATVTVHPLPVLAASISSTPGADNCGNNTIYIGYGQQSLNLNIAGATGGTPAYSYSWTPAATVTGSTVGSGTAGATVNPTSTTLYTVTVTDANGCTASKGTTIRVRDVRCGNNNNMVQVCHNTGSATNPTTALCVSPSAVPAHLANHGDCLGDCTNPFAKSVAHTSTLHLEDGSVTVYPNPARGKINIALPETGSAYSAYQIIDITGRVVLSGQLGGDIHADLITIDISALTPGLYTLRAVTESGAGVTKFTVQ